MRPYEYGHLATRVAPCFGRLEPLKADSRVPAKWHLQIFANESERFLILKLCSVIRAGETVDRPLYPNLLTIPAELHLATQILLPTQ